MSDNSLWPSTYGTVYETRQVYLPCIFMAATENCKSEHKEQTLKYKARERSFQNNFHLCRKLDQLNLAWLLSGPCQNKMII